MCLVSGLYNVWTNQGKITAHVRKAYQLGVSEADIVFLLKKEKIPLWRMGDPKSNPWWEVR